jgi:hypothetical protein
MKPVHLITLLLLIACISCFAQDGNVNLYAYRQGVSSGVRPEVSGDGAGQGLPEGTSAAVNYFIYLSHPPGVRVYPVALWIDGEPYGVKWQPVAQKPVELSSGGETGQEEKTTLVPATADEVLRLTPVAYIPGKEERPAPSLLKEYQLVVVYRQGGKLHTKAVKTLQALSRASRP